jgi:hypothetical protein
VLSPLTVGPYAGSLRVAETSAAARQVFGGAKDPVDPPEDPDLGAGESEGLDADPPPEVEPGSPPDVQPTRAPTVVSDMTIATGNTIRHHLLRGEISEFQGLIQTARSGLVTSV